MDFFSDNPQLRRFLKQVVIMGAALLLVALVLKLAGVHYNDALLTVGFGTLAIVAFFLDRLFPAPADALMGAIWNFAMRLTGYSAAVALMGALFVLQHWPGGKPMLVAGGISLLACGLVWLFYIIKKNNNINT